MIRDEVVYILVFLPLCLGMIGAFFAAKKGRIREQYFRSQPMSASLWHGYAVGNYVCISSYLMMAITLFFMGRTSFEAAFVIFSLVLFFASLFSMLIGVVLYLPCAFFGYNVFARKLAEEELARTQQQIIKDVKSEKTTKKII
jgi:predicted membrane protein